MPEGRKSQFVHAHGPWTLYYVPQMISRTGRCIFKSRSCCVWIQLCCGVRLRWLNVYELISIFPGCGLKLVLRVADNAIAIFSTEFSCMVAMSFLQQMAVKCSTQERVLSAILCLGWAADTKGSNSPWNTGNGRKLPNSPQGFPFKPLLHQKYIERKRSNFYIFNIPWNNFSHCV